MYLHQFTMLLFKIVQFLSIALIVLAFIVLLCNAWQKKYDKKHYSKYLSKEVVKFLLGGIGGVIVSGIFLQLHIY